MGRLGRRCSESQFSQNSELCFYGNRQCIQHPVPHEALDTDPFCYFRLLPSPNSGSLGALIVLLHLCITSLSPLLRNSRRTGVGSSADERFCAALAGA